MTVQIKIGDHVFAVRKALAEDLIKVIDGGKRFWEWENTIADLRWENKCLREMKGVTPCSHRNATMVTRNHVLGYLCDDCGNFMPTEDGGGEKK